MNETHDWRGVYPFGHIRKWVIAWTLSPLSDGALRRVYFCWTRAGALRKIEYLDAAAERNEQYQRDACITNPSRFRYELIGHLKDHPRRQAYDRAR